MSSTSHPSPRGFLDHIILTRKLDDREQLKLTGGWQEFHRKQPRTGKYETWQRHDQSHQGWRVDVQQEQRAVEIRLGVPRLMGHPAVNYPLQPLDILRLDPIRREVAKVTGLLPGRIDWQRMGVREVAFSADLIVPEKHEEHIGGILNAVGNLSHAGEWIHRNTSTHWTTGSREVQVYAKAEQLRRHLRRSFETFAGEHAEVDRVVRFEVKLGASDVREVFGLQASWLPMLSLITSHVAAYVLVREIRDRFRLDSEIRRPTREHDNLAGLAHAILEATKEQGEVISFSMLSQLIAMKVLLSMHGTPKDVCAIYGGSTAQAGKLRRRLEELGFPVARSVDAYSHACLLIFRSMFLEQYPGHPKKPVLTLEQQHGMTIEAPWADVVDPEDDLKALSIDEYIPKDLQSSDPA